MTDFRPHILKNLGIYPGYVEEPDRIETLNDILNDLDALGFDRLVQNFCTQPDPERACDFLFEIWICQMLRRNQDVQYLKYEPPEMPNPPDFRFLIHGVSFDIQVKRLHNVTNELTKVLFKRECQRHLSDMPKPWLINFWVSNHFTRQDLNPFFAFLKGSIEQFTPVATLDTFLGEPQYPWEQNGLFRSNNFSKICGLILVPPQVGVFSECFKGDYLPHPSHVQNIRCHPKPFEEMMFAGP